MFLKPGLTLTFLLRIHCVEEGLCAAKDAARLEVRYAGQTCHGIQPRTALQSFLRRCGEFLPLAVADDAHGLITHSYSPVHVDV